MDWSSFWGAFVGNIADIAILVILIKIIRKLTQFKKEGEDDSWLK